MLRVLIGLMALWWSLSSPLAAWAQPSAQDRIRAQALFEDGVRLVEQRAYEEACPKFEESHKLDPGIGVRFRLADCYELSGRLTPAWILFVDVAAEARAQGQPDRSLAARRRADALHPRLIKLTIDVREPFAELSVTHNGVPVSRAQWGTAVPVEPGDHVIAARAPGHEPFRKVVTAEGEGTQLEVVVPPLRELPDPAPRLPPPDPAPPPFEPPMVQYAFAIGLGAVGVIGIGIGSVAGIIAIDKTNEADRYCEGEGATLQCFDRGVALRDEARDAAAVSTVAIVVGAAAIAGGLILWLTADDDPQAMVMGIRPMWEPTTQPYGPPQPYGLSVVGRF